MQPLLVIVVGYIIGVIWGLYLETSVVPILFLGLGGALVYLWKRDFLVKYKMQIILLIFCIVVSNFQIRYLEDKFDNLYSGLSEVKVIRSCCKWGKIPEIIKIHIP